MFTRFCGKSRSALPSVELSSITRISPATGIVAARLFTVFLSHAPSLWETTITLTTGECSGNTIS